MAGPPQRPERGVTVRKVLRLGRAGAAPAPEDSVTEAAGPPGLADDALAI